MTKRNKPVNLEKFTDDIQEAYQASLMLKELDSCELNNHLCEQLREIATQVQKGLINKLYDEIGMVYLS